MPTATAFGRRGAPTPPQPRRPRQPPSARAAEPAPPAPDLSAEAEAFRASLAADRGGRSDAFGDWRRSTNWERWLMWGVRLFSFAPGLISFVIDAPIELSIGLEVAAFAGNIWFRTTRRRRMREVVAWKDPNEAP
jgi:hypothetical protein